MLARWQGEAIGRLLFLLLLLLALLLSKSRPCSGRAPRYRSAQPLCVVRAQMRLIIVNQSTCANFVTAAFIASAATISIFLFLCTTPRALLRNRNTRVRVHIHAHTAVHIQHLHTYLNKRTLQFLFAERGASCQRKWQLRSALPVPQPYSPLQRMPIKEVAKKQQQHRDIWYNGNN